ncbi:hypothetical protein [Pedobacter frigoris]|uniref:hypothetical protein n=1 Tax=Pedobacter frigoris TaxID=2571272 RepID=UPI00292D754A|nr:hypothetical protein [Pedobacter frigoris]
MFLLLCTSLSAQQKFDCDKVLDTEPYFVKNKSGEKDHSLIRDIEILKRCGNFNSTDSAFLKGPILGVLMLEQVNAGKPATYRTIVDFFAEFRKTNKYKDFEYGLSLYKKIGQKRIDLKNWDADQELFVRMGFTVNDLNDFKAFMSQPEQAGLTYMAALTKYMTEIDAMSADK